MIGRDRPGRPRSRGRSRGAAARALSSRELVDACLARIRERDGVRTATTATPTRSTPGCGSTRRTRCAAADRADERLAAGDAPDALRHPDRAQGSLRRRRQAADRVERRARRGARARLRRVGAARRRGDGAARPPAHARVRLRRHDRPGRQPVGARAVGGRLERRLRARRSPRGRCLRPPAPTPPARCASPRRSAGRRRSSRRAGSSRCAASSRSRRPSTMPGRWRGRCADCEPLLAAMAGVVAPPERRAAAPVRRLSADRRARPGRRRRVRAGARGASGRARRAAAPARPRSTSSAEFFDLVLTEMLAYHRRFDDRRDAYRQSNRARLEHAERAGDDGRGVRRRPGGAPRTPPPGATGSPSTGSTRSSSRPSRSSRPCAAAATTRRSATSRSSR